MNFLTKLLPGLAQAEDVVEKTESKAEDVINEFEKNVKGAENRVIVMAREFLRMEASGGILLVLAAIVALLIANSPLSSVYQYVLNDVDFRIGFSDVVVNFETEIKKSLLLWINDGLMAIFFFLIGLEIKREFLQGELSSRTRIILPFIAAFGGVVVPSGIFWFINHGDPAAINGWAIPAATDIAFALGVLALLGDRIPTSLKVLLTAIAVIDDLAAILIIAVFYSHGLTIPPLYFAAAAIFILFAMNRKKVVKTAPYMIIGVILWVAVLKSGVHATLAGVVVAMFIPISDKKGQSDPKSSPLKRIEHSLHPWVAFFILPLFAFANAGVPFFNLTFEDMFNPVSLGIAAGLLIGKPLGIYSTIWFAIKTGLSPRPKNASNIQLYGIATLCGIGFTMSLFIGALSYEDTAMQAAVRVGVLGGSVLSAALGALILYFTTPAPAHQAENSSVSSDGKNKGAS